MNSIVIFLNGDNLINNLFCKIIKKYRYVLSLKQFPKFYKPNHRAKSCESFSASIASKLAQIIQSAPVMTQLLNITLIVLESTALKQLKNLLDGIICEKINSCINYFGNLSNIGSRVSKNKMVCPPSHDRLFSNILVLLLCQARLTPIVPEQP